MLGKVEDRKRGVAGLLLGRTERLGPRLGFRSERVSVCAGKDLA